MKAKTIKLFKSVDLIIDGEKESFKDMPALWDRLKWDIESDPNAKECSELITRELFCFRVMDISALTGYKHSVVIEWN